MTGPDTNELEWAIGKWEQAATGGTVASKNACLRTAKALGIQKKTGIPVCICHFKPLKDCPNIKYCTIKGY